MELQRTFQLSWRKFLSSEAGVMGLLYLRSLTPGIQKGKPEEMIYDGGYVQGYGKCLDRIQELVDESKPSMVSEENK